MDHKPTIAVMLPGEIFSRKWVHAWTNLVCSTLGGGYDLAPLFGFASSPHTTRSALMMECLNAPANVQIDYVLWIDDDNIVLPEHLKKLMSVLQSRPDVDMVAGWCWIEGDTESGRAARVSSGMWARDYTQQSFSADAMEMEAQNKKLMIADWTGFPLVLMRMDVLRKIGPHPFAGIPGDQFLHGMCGEDIAFCIRASQKGLTLVVDPTVKVEHLKVQPVPDPPKRKVIDLSAPVAVVRRAARKFKYSVCHTTARPAKYQAAYNQWIRTSREPFEYVLCADRRWGFDPHISSSHEGELLRVVWNEGPKSAVSGWNTAFAAATGDVLIMASDDCFPPQNWDELLSEAIGDRYPAAEDFAIRVNTANPNQARDLFPTIISRARYERLGYALYPEYDAWCADDDDCEHILLDVAEGRSTLIDARASIMFEERNPSFSGEAVDEVYAHQTRRAARELGASVLARRRAAKFEGVRELAEVAL